MPPESDSTVVVTPVQGVGEGLSQEGRNGAHNHPTDAPLTDDEREALRLWGVSIHGSREDDHRALDALVESILSARLDALRAETEGSLSMQTLQRMRTERDAARAENQRLREIMTPAQRELDGIGITWQSRAKRMAERLERARAERDALRDAITALADEAVYADFTHYLPDGDAVGPEEIVLGVRESELRALLPEAGERP